MPVKRKSSVPLKKSDKKSSKKQPHFVVLLWGVMKMLTSSLTSHIRSLWYLNPIHVVNRRHKRLYFTDDNGEIPVKPRWMERMMDVFRSDAKRQMLLLSWLQKKIPYQNPVNFSSSWNDGIALCALLEALRPGVCPEYPNMQHHNIIINCRLGIKLAQQCFNLPQNMITAEEMAIADRRTEQKIFQFICVIKWLSEQSYPKSRDVVVLPEVPLQCHVRGSGLCTGVTGRKARFTFHTTDICRISDIAVNIRGPRHDVYCERIVNMLNSNLPPNNNKTTTNEKKDTNTIQQAFGKLASTEHVHGYLDDGFGNIFLHVKDLERMTNGNATTNTISFSCQCNGKGSFLFTFVPIFAGIHTISVKTGSQHVGESPFKVKIYQPCDLKQRTTNDTKDKLFGLDSMSMGSIDEHSNIKESNSQYRNNSNSNEKSPRKSERLRLKRQFTIRKRKVLRKVITKNGEDISILDSPSVPSRSRETSVSTDSDITEDEPRGTISDMYGCDNGNPSEATRLKQKSVKGAKTQDGDAHFTESVQKRWTKSDIPDQNFNTDMSTSVRALNILSRNRENVSDMKNNQTTQGKRIKPSDYKGIHSCDEEKSRHYGTGHQHNSVKQLNKKGNELSNSEYGCSIADTQGHLQGYEDASSQNEVICGVLEELSNYNKLSEQSSVDSPGVFSIMRQSCNTTPSTTASEMTSSSLSNFSLFGGGTIDDVSPCSSMCSVKSDNSNCTQSPQPLDTINDESVSTAAHHTPDVVTINSVQAAALSMDLDHASHYTNRYRSYTSVENSPVASFGSAFSKPEKCILQSGDCSDLTHDSNIYRCDDLRVDKYKDHSEAAAGFVGQERYLKQRVPACHDDHVVSPEQTTHIVTIQCDNTTPLTVVTDSTDAPYRKRIDLYDGEQTYEGKETRQTPFPSIGILGVSTSDASPGPDITTSFNKFQEWGDGKYEDLIRRKSDTAICNKLQNTTLMMFHTIPSFETAVCLPSNMNIVVPTPHREKCTQVTENDIIEATGWTLRMSCFRLIRKRICIKINSEENISADTIENAIVKENCVSFIHHPCFRQTTHGTKEGEPSTGILGPVIRSASNETEIQELRNKDRKSIRHSTNETFDSGIADENVKPSSAMPIGITVDTRCTFLSGHKLVHRRPYRGVIHLDPKLVRSSSTPDSTIDEEGRYYTSSQSHSQESGSNGSDDLPYCAVTKRKYLRHLSKGQSFSLSDSDLYLYGMLSTRFNIGRPSIAKTAEQTGLFHRVLRSDNNSYDDDAFHYRENIEMETEGSFEVKHSYGTTDVGTTGMIFNSEQTTNSETGSFSDETFCRTKGDLIHDDLQLGKYSNDNARSHTRGSNVQSHFYDINDWNLETNNNERNLDPFSSRLQSLDDSYRGFGMSKDAQSKLLQTIAVFQDSTSTKENVFDYNEHQSHPTKEDVFNYNEHQSATSKEDNIRYNTVLNTGIEEDEDDIGAMVHYSPAGQETTADPMEHGQTNNTRESRTEETYRGFGVNEQGRTDLLQNLTGFQNLENGTDAIHMRNTSLQRIEAVEINISDTPYQHNETRHINNLHHDKQHINPNLPTHFISSIDFQVQASVVRYISALYRPPYCPSVSSNIEKTEPDEESNVEYTGDTTDTGLCGFDIFGLTEEELRLMSNTDQENMNTKTDQLHVEGIALTQGYVGVKNNFQIWATSDVTGCPTVSIYGPHPHCVTETCVVYTGDGLYEVMYEVTHPGNYFINVKWCDLDLQESPYLCKITY